MVMGEWSLCPYLNPWALFHYVFLPLLCWGGGVRGGERAVRWCWAARWCETMVLGHWELCWLLFSAGFRRRFFRNSGRFQLGVRHLLSSHPFFPSSHLFNCCLFYWKHRAFSISYFFISFFFPVVYTNGPYMCCKTRYKISVVSKRVCRSACSQNSK